MRAESAEFVGENLLTELTPFIFSMKDGRNSVEIRNVPISFAPLLWGKIQDMLEFNDHIKRR